MNDEVRSPKSEVRSWATPQPTVLPRPAAEQAADDGVSSFGLRHSFVIRHSSFVIPLPPPVIRLHIKRLVLDGLPLLPGGAARLQSALEAEFGRLLTGVPAANWASVSLASLAPASLRLAPGGSPEAWGRQAARSLFAGLPMSASDGATENTFTGDPARFAGPSMEKPKTKEPIKYEQTE